jgi:hypothetical protein
MAYEPRILLFGGCRYGRLVTAAPPERPRTFANPINIEYRFMTDLPSRREAADPAIVLFGSDYYLFASKSGGYWRSADLVDRTFVKPSGLPIEAYAPAVMAYDGVLYYSTCNIGLYKTKDPKESKWELLEKAVRRRRSRSVCRLTAASISTTGCPTTVESPEWNCPSYLDLDRALYPG